MKSLRNAFFSGMFLLLPLGITLMVINFLVDTIGKPSSQIFFGFLHPSARHPFWMDTGLKLISTFIVILLVTAFGYLSNYFLGRWFVKTTERLIRKVPFVSKVYTSVKQVVATFGEQRNQMFQHAVLVQFPINASYTIGFVTTQASGELATKFTEDHVTVFIPTTPNPTSGFLLVVPKEALIYLDMPVGEALKMLISGGCVVPTYPYLVPKDL